MAYRPFAKVPPELLSHILTFAWLSDTKDDSLCRYLLPSITSQVDRYFNCTTITTPILWSYLRVTTPSNLPHIQDRIVNKSGALPLDVYIIFAGVESNDAKIMVERTILYSPLRCRTITLSHRTMVPICYSELLSTDPPTRFWDHLQPLATLQAPLQITRLSLLNDWASDDKLRFLPSLGSSLHSLHLSKCRFQWPPASLPENLKVLSISDQDDTDVAGIQIQRCLDGPIRHSLISLSLNGIALNLDEPLVPYTLGNLEHFELHTFYLNEVAIMFSILHMPNLRHLSLKSIYRDRISNHLIASWKTPKFPNLYKFTFQNFMINPADQIEFIQQLQSSVKCLEISDGDSVAPLLEAPTSALCNQLHEIITHNIPLHTLASWVEGRCLSLQKLEARFGKVTSIYDSLTQDQLSTQFSLLEALVPDFTVLVEAADPGAGKPSRLGLDQVLALYGDNNPGSRAWSMQSIQ